MGFHDDQPDAGEIGIGKKFDLAALDIADKNVCFMGRDLKFQAKNRNSDGF